MLASYKKHILNFKRPSGTSRGILTEKETWFLILEENGKTGIGECGILRTLSIDDRPDYEEKLKWACQNIHKGLDVLLDQLVEYPSIQFGLEIAFKSLQSHSSFDLFPSEFTAGKDSIPINGLIWMGDKVFMKDQIDEKLASGFSCIKMKIGAINFEEELKLLDFIRSNYDKNTIELRVDANGAFTYEEAMNKLNSLAVFDLHSIEQPIKQGQINEMTDLCQGTPIPIALDEELIGIYDVTKKDKLLQTIKPQFIILKPSLIGGYRGTDEWIALADKYNVGWWITSALESNIGLNAIAQFTYTLKSPLPQGLGTGGLYTNNFDSPLSVNNGELKYDTNLNWNIKL